jgi:hypothetical protein
MVSTRYQEPTVDSLNYKSIYTNPDDGGKKSSSSSFVESRIWEFFFLGGAEGGELMFLFSIMQGRLERYAFL